MTQEALMRLMCTQLRDSRRVNEVSGRVVQGLICMDVIGDDGTVYFFTGHNLGQNRRVYPLDRIVADRTAAPSREKPQKKASNDGHPSSN